MTETRTPDHEWSGADQKLAAETRAIGCLRRLHTQDYHVGLPGWHGPPHDDGSVCITWELSCHGFSLSRRKRTIHRNVKSMIGEL